MQRLEGLTATLGEARAVGALFVHVVGEDALTDVLEHLQQPQFSETRQQRQMAGAVK